MAQIYEPSKVYNTKPWMDLESILSYDVVPEWNKAMQ